MLRQVTDITGLRIAARDADLGKVRDFYFDDDRWVVRHIEVDTGGWLTGRRVLISPQAIESMDWVENRMHVALTREQIEGSPPVSADRPVSREQEASLYLHYGYPVYWSGPGPWGAGGLPMTPGLGSPPGTPVATDPVSVEAENRIAMERARDNAGALRSCNELVGYGIAASDGDIGHVEDFLVDDADWAIRYVLIDTRGWLLGRRLPIAVRWIEDVSWSGEKLLVRLDRARIESSPEYLGRLGRDDEIRLHRHYGREGYWVNGGTRHSDESNCSRHSSERNTSRHSGESRKP